ncbi:asparagine synthase (glutamine-hydrolyzing) [Atopobacter phocae]|uniref:asparagine synthase (glutamine-hydrolyzing) n=1 Tax=Atopobacter phocae TaxID=136492 RepID=UPI0004716CEA|nr:asparagine synthase (glutamine-hydrolyzing) [Atopobacter phocae]
MCGFVGYINGTDGVLENNKNILETMMQRIVHRGPDSSGVFMDDQAALGFRRLAIIDLTESGNQPFYSEDERYVMVFNGEIYNFKALREELKQLGHNFLSQTDSEVIIRGYEEYGEAIVNQLRGMFAFCIWDRQEKSALIARDGFGIKPLYYTKHTTDGSFIFGSEVKTFLDHPRFIKEFNHQALQPYLSFQYNPLIETFFEGVYKLQPGHYMKVKDGQIETIQYWDKKFDENTSKKATLPLEHYVKEVKDTVKGSVDIHSISDVKVGSFLSGGVDSSYITALLNPEHSFSVGFNQYEAMFNETDIAKSLSEQLNIDNQRKFVSDEEAFEKIETIMYHLDEPDSNPSVVPLYFLSQLASEHVKVVLSGEGADEIFGGYDWYKPSRLNDFYTKFPLTFRRSLHQMLKKNTGKESRLERFLERGIHPIEERFIGQALVYTDHEAYNLLLEPYRMGITTAHVTRPYYEKVKHLDDLSKMQYLDLNLWLQGDILQKADKMSMAHSIELRVPFLDKEVMELAKTIPTEYRANYNNTKIVLRQAAREVLPEEWAKRKKVGFPVPIRHWLRKEPFYSHVREMFLSDLALKFFEQDVLLHLLDDHRDQVMDAGRRIWTVYVFLVWYKRFFIDDKGLCQTKLD